MCSLGFKSYLGLQNRSQSVRVGSVSSNSFTLTTGVPQGSVLGNVLFQFTFHLSVPSLLLTICSTSSLRMTLNCTSLYPPQIMRLQSPGSNPVSLIFTVGFHTAASVWILQNRMLFCLVLKKVSAHFHTSINIAGCVVHLSDTVTTLGINLDQTLNLQRHVNNLCKSS